MNPSLHNPPYPSWAIRGPWSATPLPPKPLTNPEVFQVFEQARLRAIQDIGEEALQKKIKEVLRIDSLETLLAHEEGLGILLGYCVLRNWLWRD